MKNMKNMKSKIMLLAALIGFNACGDWLDVVPEGIPTIEMAFTSRAQTLKYLYTCYAYLPRNGDVNSDPAMLGGDELWTHLNTDVANMTSWMNHQGDYIALGRQNATSPLLNIWNSMYQGIRDCNIFLENVRSVPDLESWECNQWIAEVKVLKAWYHFCLVQRYGPVPIVRENIPVNADLAEVKVVRAPVDDCFQYIVELLDEAAEGDILPLNVVDINREMGRITKPVALSVKAKALVTAASPLFNGNSEQATLRNPDGAQLFNVTKDDAKWDKAALACKDAIEACEKANIAFYEYPNVGSNPLTDVIALQMSLRNAFTLRFNSGIIWANSQSQIYDVRFMAPTLDPRYRNSSQTHTKVLGVPLKIVTMFYTENGVPLNEDKTRDYSQLYNLRTAQRDEDLYVKSGRVTVDMHFEREPRFYAWVGFDGGTWYGQGRVDDKDELFFFDSRSGGIDAPISAGWSGFGTIPKKLVPYTNTSISNDSYSLTNYPMPVIRLSDLYLLYAEAINEAEGPDGPNSAEMFDYIDKVRINAGLEGVKYSWDTYTNNPKYNNQTGMRQIIQQERMIELVFEGQRFWDVRRWKTVQELYRTPIETWNTQEWMDIPFYTPKVIFDQKFGIRDYFWPIANYDIIVNPNLVQNIGW